MPKKVLGCVVNNSLTYYCGKTQLIYDLIESGRWVYFADNFMGHICRMSGIDSSVGAIRLYGGIS